MEGKSASEDMISMSRPSRDNRSSKIVKASSEAIPPSSKKSQIRAAPASKKPKTEGETLAGASTKPETGSGVSEKTSRLVSRSKRAAENGGDVTLDALRPVKKRKISEAKSLKSEGENGVTTAAHAELPTVNYALRNADSAGNPSGEINAHAGRSAQQISSGGKSNGPDLSEAAANVEEERRALRPRPKLTAPKVKKRTRFHEVTIREEDGPRIVGRRIKVYWPLEKKFFYGHVKAFNAARKLQYKIVYDDKDEEWLRLQNEVFGIELVPGEVFGGSVSAPSTEATPANRPDSSDKNIRESEDAADATLESGPDKPVEATNQGRIKPEGVYRRKRKAERTSEEEKQPLEARTREHETKSEEDVSKSTQKRDDEDGETKEKPERGFAEQEQKLEGKKGAVGKRTEVSKQREASGRANGKRSSSGDISGLREQRRKGTVLVGTTRSTREKVLLSGDASVERRKRTARDMAPRSRSSSSSTFQTRTRNSILATANGGKKNLRSRIRDDDRLFPSVKSSIIRRKVTEGKRVEESKFGTVDLKQSHEEIGVEIGIEDEKIKSKSRVRKRADHEDNSAAQNHKQGADDTQGPFEAVMDAYREALSGPSRIEEKPSLVCEGSDQTSLLGGECDVAGDVVDIQDHDGLYLGGIPEKPLASSAFVGDVANGSASQQARNGADNESIREGVKFSLDGHHFGEEISETEVVPPISPVSRPLRHELNLSPDKVFRRHNPDKVYRRLKHSRNRISNEGVDEQADVPVLPVARYWVWARALHSTSHVLSQGARIAALGSSFTRFNRTALFGLQCRSCFEDSRLQLGMFYGTPSMQSLLRVSWKSLQWLFASIPLSVNALETVSYSRSREFKLHVTTPNGRFTRRVIPFRKAFQRVTLLSQLSDPAREWKHLSLSARYFRCLAVRRTGSAPKCVAIVVGAPRALASVHLFSSSHLTPSPHGRSASHVYTGGRLVVYSEVLRRALSLSDPLISDRKTSWINGLLDRSLAAAAQAWSVGAFPIVPAAGDQSRSSHRNYNEIGTYYGRQSLRSLLRVTRDRTFKIEAGSLTFTSGWGNVVSVDLRSVLRAIADLHAAAGDADSLPSVRLTPRESFEGEIFSSLLSRGDGVGRNGSASTKGFDHPVMGPWFMGAPTSVQSTGSNSTMPRYGGKIPHVLTISEDFVVSTCAAPPGFIVRSDLNIPAHSPQISGWAVAALEGPANPQKTECQDSDIECKEVGAYYGPPSVESILRLSKALLVQMLGRGGKVLETFYNTTATTDAHKNEDAGPPCPELSSIETACDDELSDQEDIMQVTSEERTLAEESSAFVQERSFVGDGFDSFRVPSRSVMPTKKGRRTGKGLKRGFGNNDGDAFVRDGVGGDFYQGSDTLNGRPYSKRTRFEIESSGDVSNRDSGVETSPQSDLEGKAFAAPSLLTQEKPSTACLPRVNVLKLRRCPTNKGLWLVAGNSIVTSQDRGMREPEGSASLDSHELGEGGDPMTPIFETSRKRSLDQCLESPQVGRSDHTMNTALPTNFVNNTDCCPASQDLDITALGMKSTKGLSLNSKSKDLWLDSGIAPPNGVADGLETRKRGRKGASPTAVDENDQMSELSVQRSADPGWGACSVNVLITKSDRCVRERAAVVELQPGHGNSCMLTVSIRGETKYALKADHPVASGTTNKFTHSMMWRGGKTWSLEFVDRKQWQVFKDLHEECFQRNVRAASVRHIPIPGVKPIQESPKSGLRFVRPSLKYIHQYDGEVEMALASTRVIYDMDSEDEEWLKQVNSEKVTVRGSRSRPKIDEDTLERVMDKLEKAAFIRQQDLASSEVAGDVCQTLGSQDVFKTIHAYWQEKRHRKGMALIRHFQPPPWEQYQCQLQDWQAKVDQLQQQSPTASKQHLQSVCKRPPLFAFCLRPRGLEVRNKMQKQRSQRKQGLGGSSSRQWTLAGPPPNDFFLDSPFKRHPPFDTMNGPCGPKRFVPSRIQEDNFSDAMGVDLAESFNSLAGEGFASLGAAGQAIPEGNKGSLPRVENSSVLGFETSTAGGFKKRSKKVGRKAKRMKLLAAAEESRRRRQLRAQEGLVNGGGFVDMLPSPHYLSEISQLPLDADPSTSGTSFPQVDAEVEERMAHAKAAEAHAKAKRETAVLLRSRAQALYAVADAAMHKAVAAVIAADAIHATERAVEEAAKRKEQETFRQQTGEACVAGNDARQVWTPPEASAGVASFGSWRRALNSASKNANHVLSKGSSSKPGLITDTDDPLLPVASWSQELGAGLGTRLLQTGEVSPQRQRYSPVLVDGLSKSPVRVRGENLVGLGRTRGESMMAMLTR